MNSAPLSRKRGKNPRLSLFGRTGGILLSGIRQRMNTREVIIVGTSQMS